MKFTEKLSMAIASAGTPLMLGLDPELSKLPQVLNQRVRSGNEAILLYCQEIISGTADFCCGYKLNLAFFEALGAEGMHVFERILKIIPDNKIVLADAKRGDIGNTARQYAHAYYRTFGCDAITVNPLMGRDSLLPFLEDEDKAAFVLALTSNPGAKDVLLRELADGQKSVSVYIAELLAALQQEPEVSTHIGMVVGATQTKAFESVSHAFPQASLLIPGFGTQGGSLEELEPLMQAHEGQSIPVISRSIIYNYREDDPQWLNAVADAAQKQAKIFKPLIKS